MNTITAKKSLGQNFLIDQEALNRIANTLPIEGNRIIEVGPGYGALTDSIIQKSPLSLDLVELDPDMIAILEKKYIDPTIQIHHQDVLGYIPPYTSYSVIANIPYYITSPILFHFLYGLENRPHAMVILMQEEVGKKILEGRAKKPHHSYFSLCMEQACDTIERVCLVGRASFDPAPKVDSIVLRFDVTANRNTEQEKELISLWKVAFTHPRKTLLSNIKGSQYNLENIRTVLIEKGYDERVRAEALKKEDWIFLLPSSFYINSQV